MKTTTDIGSQLKNLRTRITRANGLSWTAVVLALTGSAFANHLQVFSSDIVNGEVKTPDLATSAVTNSKIAASAVTGAKIAAGAVTTSKIAAGAVTTGKLADNAVTGAKIAESTLGIVPNSDKLDGLDSADFVIGPGRVVSGYLPISRGLTGFVVDKLVAAEVGFGLIYSCPATSVQNTIAELFNVGPSTLDVWVQAVDSTSSSALTQVRVAPGSSVPVTHFDTQAAYTFHVGERLSNWHATIHFQTVADRTHCHTFVQAITSG